MLELLSHAVCDSMENPRSGRADQRRPGVVGPVGRVRDGMAPPATLWFLVGGHVVPRNGTTRLQRAVDFSEPQPLASRRVDPGGAAAHTAGINPAARRI